MHGFGALAAILTRAVRLSAFSGFPNILGTILFWGVLIIRIIVQGAV